ncbi:MAG: hypothetical protein Q7J73_00655 [Dehalococcoidales bacterium]|nr:hypothetical protein [Dehalococcoidales bacterium]
MIETYYRDLCTVKRRQATTTYGGAGADQYDTYATLIPCYFVEKDGRLERQSEAGRDIIYSGVCITDEVLSESDMLEINAIEYRILRVLPLRDFVTGLIKNYRAYVERTAVTDVDAKNNEPVINL